MTARELTEALGGKWRGRRGWALCPAHIEKTGSLTIMEGDKQPIIVHCFGGCSNSTVITALQARNLWLFKDEKPAFVPRESKPAPAAIDFDSLLAKWMSRTTPKLIEAHAKQLGVSTESLTRLCACWAFEYSAWAFPMRDPDGKVVGIRLRDPDSGKKWAVTGSLGGLFFADSQPETLWVVEGPTDTAAALSMGLDVIGRPSCNSCVDFTLAYISRIKPKLVVYVCDNDEPGVNGAVELQKQTLEPSALWIPPTKDIRKYLAKGGDKETIEAMLSGARWTRRKFK